ncbi:MAG TPA: PIN domain-containing protein [Polyangia bacterium]|nr:PIN domain-containing protein [Polyangia bacterium]
MILLDTHTLMWLLSGHKRARRLPPRERLFVSPVTLLELRLLEEIGRFEIESSARLEDDPRFAVDNPSSAALFDAAARLPWTRDPFDRLVVGHALMRSWRLATADTRILDYLPRESVFEI